MELKKALVLRMSFNDMQGEIRIDNNGYVCLNDLNAYFPHKKLNEWKKNKSTIEFIEVVDAFLNKGNVPYLKSIISKRGKYNGGTYANEDVAMDFCMWLSPEFKLTVIQAFRNGTQRKEDWNIKRILAANNYKMLTQSVKDAHDPVKPFHYSNEAKMMNVIVFGRHDKGLRDIASEDQLNDLAWLESKNSAYIDIEMPYQERKETLARLYQKRKQKQIEAN